MAFNAPWQGAPVIIIPYSKITGQIFIHPFIHPFLFPINLNIISLTKKCKKVHNST